MSSIWKPGGRWMVVTWPLFTRHHKLSEARKVARRFNSALGARVRRYRRGDTVADEIHGRILREDYGQTQRTARQTAAYWARRDRFGADDYPAATPSLPEV